MRAGAAVVGGVAAAPISSTRLAVQARSYAWTLASCKVETFLFLEGAGGVHAATAMGAAGMALGLAAGLARGSSAFRL